MSDCRPSISERLCSVGRRCHCQQLLRQRSPRRRAKHRYRPRAIALAGGPICDRIPFSLLVWSSPRCDGRSARTPKACGGGMAADRRQKNGPTETAAHEVWRSLTSRGEQLLQRYWEEKTAMCISCAHYAHFLIGWKTFIVQRSYANAAALPNHWQRRLYHAALCTTSASSHSAAARASSLSSGSYLEMDAKLADLKLSHGSSSSLTSSDMT